MMKERLLNSLIIFLGVMASFAFYNFWQTGAEPPKNIEQEHKPFTKDMEYDIKSVDKITQDEISLSQNSIDKHIRIEEPPHKIEASNIPYETVEAMKEHTQEVYDTLQPDDHEESIEKANEAFEVIDQQVLNVDAELKDHMMIATPPKNMMDVETLEVDTDYEMELPQNDD